MSVLGATDRRQSPDEVLVERRVSADAARLRRDRRDDLCATPASISTRPRRRWSIRGWPSSCAALGLHGFRDYCALVAVAGRRRRAAARCCRADHQRHPLLPRDRTISTICATEVLPRLLAAARRGGRVRIWSAACSDGQEPYSIALTVLSLMPDAADYDVKILATDIDPKMLADARAGVYDEAALETVSPAMRKHWFREVDVQGRAQVPGRRSRQAADHLQRAEPDGALADEGQVRRHLLPQRRDLFRRADAGEDLVALRRRCCRKAAISTSAIPSASRARPRTCSTIPASPPTGISASTEDARHERTRPRPGRRRFRHHARPDHRRPAAPIRTSGRRPGRRPAGGARSDQGAQSRRHHARRRDAEHERPRIPREDHAAAADAGDHGLDA